MQPLLWFLTSGKIDLLVAHNLRRVQNAMRNARLGPYHFAGSTGYGHGDLGRSALDEVCHMPLTPHHQLKYS